MSTCTQKGLTVATAELTNQIQQRESHDLERLTQEMLVHLKSSEMTLTGYVSRVVGLSTDLLTSLLSKAGAVREGEVRSEATSGITTTLQLLVSAVELLEARETLFYIFTFITKRTASIKQPPKNSSSCVSYFLRSE